jgi:general stress protein 26
MISPVSTIDERFSDSSAVAFPWEDTRSALEAAELFWLASVRADGRPHVTPLVAIWVDDALHFTTGDTEQKAVNLRANDHVVLTTGCNTWQEGVDIVLEGEAHLTTEPAALERLVEVWPSKWDGRWAYTVKDGQLHHPAGFPVLTYRVAPTKVLVFAKDPFGHTSHRFPSA